MEISYIEQEYLSSNTIAEKKTFEYALYVLKVLIISFQWQNEIH